MRGFRTVLLVAALAGLVAASVLPTGAGAQTAPKTYVVDAVDSGGSRWVSADNGTSEITVEVGDTVRWEFDQAMMGHNVTSNSPNWDRYLSEYRDPGSSTVEYTFTKTGEFRYTCTLHNGMTGIINVVPDAPANGAPTADPLVDPKTGPAPLYVHFEARASDPNGDPLTYRWDFGDGSPVSTESHAHHNYTVAGTYPATLEVSDGKGGEFTRTFQISASGANDQAPSVSAGANPTTGDASLSVTFMANGQDPQNDPLTYSWDFGVPGTDADKATGNRVFYQYDQPGVYTATVTARDPGGNEGSDTEQITVTGTAPSPPETEITAGPTGATKYATASFWFLSSEPGEGAGFECSLDEAEFTGCSAPQGYENLSEETHTFRVRAVDAGGKADESPASRTWTVDVTTPLVKSLTPKAGSSTRDRTPTIQASAKDSRTDLAGGDIKLYLDGRSTGAFAYDQTRDLLRYVPTKALSYGSHTVKVTAADEAGNTTTEAWRFKVERR